MALMEGFEDGKTDGKFDFLSASLVGNEVIGYFVGAEDGSLVGLLEVGLTVGWLVG